MAARIFCTCALLCWVSRCALGQTTLPEQAPVQAPSPPPGDLPPTPLKVDAPAPATDVFANAPAYRSPTVFVTAEYLLWWERNGPSPTLLTTGNAINNGIIFQPGSNVPPGASQLFGSSNLNYGAMSGLRFGAGVNFGENAFWGVEAWGFFLPKSSINYTSPGNTFVAVPFLDAASGQENSLAVNQAGQLNGFVSIHSDSQLWGYEFNAVAHSIRTADRTFDMLVGFRSLALNEDLSMTQQFTAENTGDFIVRPNPYSTTVYPAAPGNWANVYDSFSTQNRFYGGQLGARFGWNWGNLHLDLTGKVAIGVTEANATIFGSTTDNVAGPSYIHMVPGGTFALRSNIGSYSENPFSVVPEIGLKISYAVTSYMNVNFGYNALYWSDVARPGAQIDSVLNSKQIPTAGSLFAAPLTPTEQARPYFSFNDTAFWAQGVTLGVEFRY